MTAAVVCRELSKTYRPGVRALDRVDLDIAPGQVYGLVGRNGAGKTTLMRILVGLISATSGEASILGRPSGSAQASGVVGALIEGPAFYPHLSGTANLTLLARYAGVPRSEVARVIDLVGLTERAGSSYSGYSLGMKQRLGIAAALLGSPPVLILDEPVNGLDPQAMVQVRQLLAKLRHEGRTILLSSHLLAELEAICDRVAILHEGTVVAEGTPREIRAAHGAEGRRRIAVSDVDLAVRAVQPCPDVSSVHAVDGAVEVTYDGESPSGVIRALLEAGVDVGSVTELDSLETAYLSLTAEDVTVPGGPQLAEEDAG